MGCVMSKKVSNQPTFLLQTNQSSFRVANIDDNGVERNHGFLEVKDNQLFFYQASSLSVLQQNNMPFIPTSEPPPINWPLRCLRRYGFDSDLFSFESGRRCSTGAGVYAFKCNRAEELFQLVQESINTFSRSEASASMQRNNQILMLRDNPTAPNNLNSPVHYNNNTIPATLHDYLNQSSLLNASHSTTNNYYNTTTPTSTQYAQLDHKAMKTYNSTGLSEDSDDDNDDQVFNRPYVNSLAQQDNKQGNNEQQSNTYINLLKVNADVFNSGWLQAVRNKNFNNTPTPYINNDATTCSLQHQQSSFDGNNNDLNKNNILLPSYSPANTPALETPTFQTVFRTSNKDVNHISNGKPEARQYLNVMSDGVEDYKDIDTIKGVNKSDAYASRPDNQSDASINSNITKNSVIKNNNIYNGNNVAKNTNLYNTSNVAKNSNLYNTSNDETMKQLHYIQLDLKSSAASSPNATPNQHNSMRNRGVNGNSTPNGTRSYPRSRSPNDKYTLIDFTKTQAISKNRQGDCKTPSG